jgi:hypothetical protein
MFFSTKIALALAGLATFVVAAPAEAVEATAAINQGSATAASHCDGYSMYHCLSCFKKTDIFD